VQELPHGEGLVYWVLNSMYWQRNPIVVVIPSSLYYYLLYILLLYSQ